MNKAKKKQSKLLLALPATIQQELKILNTVIKLTIAYTHYKILQMGYKESK